VVSVGAAPRLPAGSRVVGQLSGAGRIRVTIALEPRNPAALQALATAVSTPGSSVYRRFLSVPQFRQRFAPSDAQIRAVASSLRARGLDPGPVSANGLALSLTAPASALERAFSTSLQRVALPSGRAAYANAQAPRLDSSVAGLVQGVIGLDNLHAPHPVGLRTAHRRPRATRHILTGGPQPCSTASTVAAAAGTYTTDQLAAAYGFSGLYGAGVRGAGQTVAIYELEGNFPSDITAFESCYGMTTGSVAYQPIDGGPPAPNPNPPQSDGLETELDVENVVGLAPLANVIVYQGPNSSSNFPGSGPYDVYQAIVSQDRAQVIATSWGSCEAQDGPIPTAQQAENTLFEEAAVQGQSTFAASGDTGSEDCTDGSGNPLPGFAVDDPASQPFVTGAGGTSLRTLGPPPAESVWNGQCGSGPCGGGGGVSSLWQMPSYQANAPASLGVINSNSSGAPCGASTCREVPDVSADADPNSGYLVYWHGNGSASDIAAWTGIGGTSGAAPVWAGLTADVNASPACNGTAVGFTNPSLYALPASDYQSDFYDVTAGTNALSGSGQSLYPAGPEYDMASGLGTPNAYHLAAAMCGDLVAINAPQTRTDHVSSSNPSVDVQINASDSKGNTLSFSATGLPGGVSIDPSSGLISGTPTAAGTYSVTVTASDSGGAAGQVTFSWTITTPATFTDPGPQSTVRGVPVALQITGASGGSLTATGLPPGLAIGPGGLISGAPTAAGSYPVTVTNTDGTYTAQQRFSWTVSPVSVSVANPGNQVGLVRVSTSAQAHASDNDGGTLSYSATGLPPGISIDSASGLMSGVPSSAGGYSVTLTASDGAVSQSTSFSWTISTVSVAIANPGAQKGRLGSPARLQVNAVDNNGVALAYSASGLPPGLSVNHSTGLISGRPSRAGSFAATVTATEGSSSASIPFSWEISGPPKLSTGSLTGVGSGRPKLSLRMRAGTSAPALEKIVVNLPGALRFSSTSGVVLRRPNGHRLTGFRLKLSGGKLMITLKNPAPVVRLTVGPLAISESHGLIAKVRHRSAGRLKVTVRVTDSSGHATILALKLQPS
jgi:hypothetical protein